VATDILSPLGVRAQRGHLAQLTTLS